MSGGVCRQQGIMQWPLSMFGHPSPHHHSGRLKARRSTTMHTHTHTHTCAHLILRALWKLDREWECDNKQPYVHRMRNNIWSFLCFLIFFLPLFSCLLDIMEVFMFKERTTPPTLLYLICAHPCGCVYMSLRAHTYTCGQVCVCLIWRVLMQPKYKALSMCWNAAPGMGSIIPAYFTSRVPGLELARGPLSPNRWKWAEERWRIGKRRRRNRMDRRKKKRGTGGGKESVCSH